jgi:1,5-anhydro-D-fructose reductase (1,5-anhydro-D-mannitol-forming)
MIRVAMLSFWHVHAKDYAKQAEEHPETEIVAVWDEQPERGRMEADKRGVRFFQDLDELLRQPDIEGVVVDTPSTMHRDVMVAAARAGKHIFTEKVIAPTLREAEEIVVAARESGVKLTVSLRRLYSAATVAIREIIDMGLLGDLTLVRVRDAHNGSVRTEQNPDGWLPAHFYNLPETAGGAMIDLGCHPMYLTRVFLGMPESVSASYGYVTGREVEDNAATTLRYGNGALGIVETGFVTRFSPFSIEVHGTAGSVLYSAEDGKLHIRSEHVEGASSQWLIKDVSSNEPPMAFHQWVAHIQQGTDDPENTTVGVDLSALMEASNQSARENRPVRIDEIQRHS